MLPKEYTYTHIESSTTPAVVTGSIAIATRGWTLTNARIQESFATALLTDDDLEIQVEFDSVTSGSLGIVLADGAYGIGLLLGPTLKWVDPTDYTTEIPWDWPTSAFSWQGNHVYRLRKAYTGRWTLHIDGELVADVPYLLATILATPAYYAIGLLPAAVACSATLRQFEVGCNVCVAPVEDVERFRLNLTPGIRDKWNHVMRGHIVAALGTLRHGYLMHEEVTRLDGCERHQISQVAFDPNTWTVDGTLLVTSVRGRYRLDPNTSGYAYYPRDITVPAQTEIVLSGLFTLRGSPTVDGDGKTGFVLYADDGDYFISAELVRFGTNRVGWRFGYTTSFRSPPFPIQSDITYRVELRITSEHVLLVVNGAVIDRAFYSDFAAGPSYTDATEGVGWQRNPGSTVYMDVEDLKVTRYLSDQSSRLFLRQSAAEATMFLSGDERPDEVRAWLDRRAATLRWRGTDIGIRAEARRMGFTRDAFVTEESSFAGWLLDVSFPDITPIWLDLSGEILDIYVEAGCLGSNWTAERFCELVAAYLVPVSTLTRKYHVCITTPLTATATAGTSVAVDVEDERGFAIGQSVSVVSYDRTSRSDATVTLVAPGQVTIDVLDATYVYTLGSEPFLRREVTDTIRMR